MGLELIKFIVSGRLVHQSMGIPAKLSTTIRSHQRTRVRQSTPTVFR